jgi:hypothetical protein
MAAAALVAAGTYALALNRRSWPLWLIAFALTIVALFVAYLFRDPTGPAAAPTSALAPADARVALVVAARHAGAATRPVVIHPSELLVPIDRYRGSGR